jgi:hypothetical protein
MSVKNFLSTSYKEPLHFLDFKDNDRIEEMKVISLNDLVMEVLELTTKYCSYVSKTDMIETDPGKARSAFDIWRHILVFKPETTLYQVMNELYRNRKKLYTIKCSGIHRRVFHILAPYYTLDHSYYDTMDEYGYVFSRNWETNSENNWEERQ